RPYRTPLPPPARDSVPAAGRGRRAGLDKRKCARGHQRPTNDRDRELRPASPPKRASPAVPATKGDDRKPRPRPAWTDRRIPPAGRRGALRDRDSSRHSDKRSAGSRDSPATADWGDESRSAPGHATALLR